MLDSSSIKELEISVDDEGRISAHHNATDIYGKIESCRVTTDRLRLDTIRTLVKMLRENRLAGDEIKLSGSYLYAVLLDNEVGKALNTVLTSRDRNLKLLRVNLEFWNGQQELASWPWEYLYCPMDPTQAAPDYFLARSRKLVLTRQLRLTDTVRSLTVDELPVKVLFVAASPRDLAPVRYESVQQAIKALESYGNDGGIFKVHELVRPFEDADGAGVVPTLRTFNDMVESFEPHIIHFVGHGKSVSGGGQIAFVKEDREADWVTDSDLAEELWQMDQLRLVFLQACESVLPDPHQGISGVAMRLAHRNLPAVIAMQYRIQGGVANLFARTFYEALAQFESIDAAVQAGRKEIFAGARALGESYSFGLPVLYWRRPDNLVAREAVQRFGVRGSSRNPAADLVRVPERSEERLRPGAPWPDASGMPAVNGRGEAARTDDIERVAREMQGGVMRPERSES